MQVNAKRILLNTFWLSVLLHLLVLLSFSTVFISLPDQDERPSPQYYVPAYTYTGAIQPTASTNSPTNTQAESKTQDNHSKARPLSRKIAQDLLMSPEGILPQSLLSSSQAMLKQDFYKQATKREESEPILLVGDENEVADPLIKLIGRALSAHFTYPKEAGMFGIKGRTLVEMTLSPDGYFSNAKILKSSGNSDLDRAALYAVNAAAQIKGIQKLLPQAKRFSVGFIFR